MNCINTNSKEFKQLMGETGFSPVGLSIAISTWQSENKTLEFPTSEQVSNVSKEANVLFSQEPAYEMLGSAKDYTAYSKTVENPTFIGFKEYMIDNAQPDSFNSFSSLLGQDNLAPNTEVNFNNLIGDSVYEPNHITGIETVHAKMNELIFNGKQPSEATITDVLESISTNIGENISEPILELINKAKRLKAVTTTKLQVSDVATFPEDTAMYWDSSNDTIHFDPEILVNLPTDTIIFMFLHEIAHSRSAKAILNPTTKAELAFSSTINTAYRTYNTKSDSYGFTNEMEFVSELYSNPEFVEEFKKLTEVKNLYGRILDALRTLFGVKKSSEFDTIMDNVLRVVENNSYDATIADNGIFKRTFTKLPDFTTLDNRLKNVVNKVKDNIDNSIKATKYSKATVYDDVTKRERIEALKNYSRTFDALSELDTIRNINSYTEYMLTSIRAIRSDLNQASSHRDGIRDTDILYQYEALLGSYQMMDEVSEYVSEYERSINTLVKEEQITPEEATELKDLFIELGGRVKGINSTMSDIEGRLLSHKRELAVKLIASPKFITKVETNYRQKISKEYHSLPTKPSESEQAYISKAFLRNKALIQKDLEDMAKDIVFNPSEDISRAEVLVSDYLNTNSKLFQVATNMVMDYRDKLLQTFRDKENYLGKLFKEFTASSNKSLSMTKLYSNLIQKSEKGVHYLNSKYNSKFLDTYNEMLSKVNTELYGENKAFTISQIEFNALKRVGTDVIFRETNADSIAIGDVVNLRSREKTSKVNSKVIETSTYDKGNFESERDIVAQKYTEFNSYRELEESKEYFASHSAGSLRNPDLFNYFKGKKDLVAISMNRVDNAEFSLQDTKSYQEWLKEHTDATERIDQYSHEVTKFHKPKDKYINKQYATLNEAELKSIKEFKHITNLSDKAYGNKNSLTTYIPGVEGVAYYRLPTMNKSDIERRGELDIKGMYQDFKENLKVNQADDIEIGEKLDAFGNSQKSLRIHNRGFIEPENQSLDLFSLYRREYENGLKYEARKKFEQDIRVITDVSKNKNYIRKSTRTGDTLSNSENRHQPLQFKKGIESQEYKKILGLLETNIYDIHTHHGGKIGNLETNKIFSLINGSAASVALTFNAASGIANVVNGLTQLNIDASAGYHFNLKDLTSAQHAYYKDMPNNASDLVNPVKESFSNQVLQMFDFTGGVSMIKQDFIKNGLTTKLLSKESMNSFNESGEHMMSSVLTFATLKGVKVMNAKGDLINKKGDVVTSKKDAASLFDMLEYDSKTKTLSMSNKFTYTTHTYGLRYNEGGSAHINMLIKKKSHDFYGSYDPGLQGELQKTYYGKTLMMFKKFFIPGLQYRFRGYSNIKYHPDEMRNMDKVYNSSLKEYEEGYYVTLIKAIYQSAKHLKSHGLAYAPMYYNSLSAYEKANLQKAVTELITRFVILPALALAILLAYDDDDKPYALLYQISRLQSELGQFSNPQDLTKMTTNPIAGMNIIQNSLSLLYQVMTPINLNPQGKEEHFDWLSEDSKDNNKLMKSIYKVAPISAQMSKEWKDMYNFQNK